MSANALAISKGKVASIDYTLTDDTGKVLDTSKGGQPLTYLHGGQLIRGMEKALEGKAKWDALQIVIAPEDGYGVKNEEMIQTVPRKHFGEAKEIKPGMQFQANTPQGPRVVMIVDANDQTVTVDANHELAGVTLHFDVTVTDVRDATPEELAHGHVHGPGGHQH